MNICFPNLQIENSVFPFRINEWDQEGKEASDFLIIYITELSSGLTIEEGYIINLVI